jgi:hypothetical protein
MRGQGRTVGVKSLRPQRPELQTEHSLLFFFADDAEFAAEEGIHQGVGKHAPANAPRSFSRHRLQEIRDEIVRMLQAD